MTPPSARPAERLQPITHPRRSGRCGATHHGPRSMRPPAAYLATFDPCHARSCRGTLFCLGHGVCLECGDLLRRGKGVWDAPGAEGADIDVQVLTSRGVPQ